MLAALIFPTLTQPQADSSPKALNLTVGDASAVPRAPQPLVPARKEPEPPDYIAIKKASDERLAAEEKARQEEVKRSCEEQGGHLDGADCVLPPPPPPTPEPAPITSPVTSQAVSELVGAYGYALASGNCVNTAKAWGKNQPGNPISWAPTTNVPFIGAAALFYYNHVGVVVGIHSNGDIELAHENCPGCPTRYPASSFRGFF